MAAKLPPLPGNFARTRLALHRVAEQLVAPARKPDNEIALRATPGGFGTPPFEFGGREQQVRVEGPELVLSVNGDERRVPLQSLQQAGALLGDLLPDGGELDDQPLHVDPDSARTLGDWYTLGDEVLEEMRASAGPQDDASIVQLWPEHFDIAIELGAESEGQRANYGLSPGDEDHPEPYLYVGPWTAELSGELWNGKGFNGAELGYSELADSDDPKAVAVRFCSLRKDELEAMEGRSDPRQ